MENSFQEPSEIKSDMLNRVFNPADFILVYPREFKSFEALDEQKKSEENKIYSEVVSRLTEDLLNLGCSISYASGIIIGEVAQNIVLLNRLKGHLICRGLFQKKEVLKKESTWFQQENNSTRYAQYHKYAPEECGEEVSPLIDKTLPKLQARINNGLKLLGLLPEQQLERQKITISKTLRQKLKDLENNEAVYSVKKTSQRG